LSGSLPDKDICDKQGHFFFLSGGLSGLSGSLPDRVPAPLYCHPLPFRLHTHPEDLPDKPDKGVWSGRKLRPGQG